MHRIFVPLYITSTMSLSRFLRLNIDPVSDDADRELHTMARRMAMSILDPEEHILDLTLFQGSSEYYDRVARSMIKDSELIQDMQDMIARVRRRYMSFVEYSKFIQSLEPERRRVEYSDVCCCCHESLNTWRRVVRLKSVSRDPHDCGHVIHHECSKYLKPNDSGTLSCPMCRADLGATLSFWYDTASDVPRY